LGKSLDDTRPFSKSDAVVKFKAYEFCFHREPADYVSEQNFVPLIWVKDDADEGGDGSGDVGDDVMETSEPRVGTSTAGTSSD
jgi:hypothetical protein